MAGVTYYDVLGVHADAPPEAIHSSYERRLRRYCGEQEGIENSTFGSLVAEAYATLSDPVTRRRYDKQNGLGAGLREMSDAER